MKNKRLMVTGNCSGGTNGGSVGSGNGDLPERFYRFRFGEYGLGVKQWSKGNMEHR